MRIAQLHYIDGRTFNKEIGDGDPGDYRQVIEVKDEKTMIRHVFQYRVGQPKDSNFIEYDEIGTETFI